MGHFYDKLLRPDLLVDQLLAIVNCYDKIDRSLKNQWLMFSYVKTEKERILGGRVNAERKRPLLLSRYLL